MYCPKLPACAGPETCFDCGACMAHCECDRFIVCECVRIDVDLDDNSRCLAHGPHSELARRQLEREAQAEAAWWRGGGDWPSF